MYIRQTKTDSKDSFLIAQIMRFGQYASTSLADENMVALRQLSRFRLSLVDTVGDCKRRVIALLDQVFPEYERLFCDVFGTTSRELLLRCQTPEDILEIPSFPTLGTDGPSVQSKQRSLRRKQGTGDSAVCLRHLRHHLCQGSFLLFKSDS